MGWMDEKKASEKYLSRFGRTEKAKAKKVEEPVEEPGGLDYASWSKKELKEEAKARGLQVGGSKDELIERLES